MKIDRLNGAIILVINLFIACHWTLAQKITEESRQQRRDDILIKIEEPAKPQFIIQIKKTGQPGDSISNCKPLFDNAFAKAKRKGGAHIVVTPGIYFIDGPLHLESNICLELKKGARLKFSDNPQSYLPVVTTSWEGTFCYNYSPFIYAYDKENISIIGEGIIDGNAKETFNTWRPLQAKDQQLTRQYNQQSTPVENRRFGEGHYLRPQLTQFYKCKNLLVEGITVTNSPFWCLHMLQSENATFRAINFIAKLTNNDGIDIEYSKNVLIENINFDNGDDNIAIKSGRDHEGRSTGIPSENIVVRNCLFKGLHGIVIGSEMSAGVRNVFVENCGTSGYLKRGIYIKSNPDRGGSIHDLFINNISFDEVEDCLYITSAYHGEGSAGLITDIYNIYIEDVICQKATNAGIVVQGFAEKPIKGIYLRNVNIREAAIPLSLINTEMVQMSNVSIGAEIDPAPSSAE